jgi:long-chain acyl-CoA synthetase
VTTIGFWAIAGKDAHLTAVVEPDGRVVTYGELASEADRIGRGLREAGLRAGDCVAVQLPNSGALLAAYFAALQTGLYVVPVNWHLVAAEVAYILKDSEARCFIAHERFAGAAVEAADAAGIEPAARFAVGHVPGFRPLAELGAGGSGRPAERTLGAPMVYTSGTSGRPKGVRRPLTGADPDAVPAASTWFFGLFGIRPFDGHVHLCCSPLYHTAVLNFAGISIQLGHPVVLMDGWDPQEMLRVVERHRVTHSHMVPTQFRRMLALPDEVREAYDLSSMRVMIHGAAPCPQEVKQRMLRWWGPVVVEYYAASEGGGTLITAGEWLERPGSVGRAWPGSQVRVLDADGSDVPPGEPGQVYLQMGGSTFEYHKDAEKTRTSRVGKLFTVGDIGYLDADGYLYLCDRGSDLIISGGVNIYPAEVEEALIMHAAVADVAVIGVPDPEMGQSVRAVVQPAAGQRPDDELAQRLLGHCRAKLAGFKRPRSIVFVEELPRLPTGKLLRRRVREEHGA